MDMLGPGSLRSQQPLRPSLKTYGRSKKSSASTASSSTHTSAIEGQARLFDWTRLENERRARYDAMLSARKAAKASSQRAEALFYSDLDQPDSTEDLEDIEMPRRHVVNHINGDSMALDLGLNYNEYSSFSYSDSMLEHTKRHKHRPKFSDSPEIIPSTQTSESDDNNDGDDPFTSMHMVSKDSTQNQKQQKSQHLQKVVGKKHPSLVPEKNFAEQEQEQEQGQEQKSNAHDVDIPCDWRQFQRELILAHPTRDIPPVPESNSSGIIRISITYPDTSSILERADCGSEKISQWQIKSTEQDRDNLRLECQSFIQYTANIPKPAKHRIRPTGTYHRFESGCE
ncbi:hypothetical protein BGZ82_008493 [Podila clonocystis]|nr:hypothetical protein BGZ82_008493 [Podila clonocystis]